MASESPQIKRVAKETPNVLQENIGLISKLFPYLSSEGKLDIQKIQEIVGDLADNRPDKYSFSWAGKRNAIQILQMPTRATLVPEKNQSIDFGNTRTIFIEGENLEVLKLLYKSYFHTVKMIYIDPPYNIGTDQIYVDNYTDPLAAYLKMTAQSDENGNLLTTNPETSGRYHSTWLSMMYPRLFVARQLLRDDGVIFISIDDHEVHNLSLVMNEIFGEENFVALLIWNSKRGGGGGVKTIVSEHEYVMVYANQNSPNGLDTTGKQRVEAVPLDKTDEKGPYRRGRELNKWGAGSARADRPTMWFPITGPNGEEVYPIRNDGTEGRWRKGKKGMLEIVARGDADFERRPDGTFIVYEKIRTSEPRFKPYRTILPPEAGTSADGTSSLKELFDGKIPFDFSKPPALIKYLFKIAGIEDGDVVLDFFSGSCPVVQAALEYCRSEEIALDTVVVQLPEQIKRKNGEDPVAVKIGCNTISEVGKERIRRVIAAMKQKQLTLDQQNVVEDLGVKVFRLTESNYKQWKGVEEKNPESYAAEMLSHIDSLVEGWDKENVIYEVALKEGFDLNIKIERFPFQENEAWLVKDLDKNQHFLICLDEIIKSSTIKSLKLAKDDLFICRDIALDDTSAANLALQCNLKTI